MGSTMVVPVAGFEGLLWGRPLVAFPVASLRWTTGGFISWLAASGTGGHWLTFGSKFQFPLIHHFPAPTSWRFSLTFDPYSPIELIQMAFGRTWSSLTSPNRIFLSLAYIVIKTRLEVNVVAQGSFTFDFIIIDPIHNLQSLTSKTTLILYMISYIRSSI